MGVSGRILSGFRVFYTLLWGSRWLLNFFLLLLTLFGRFWTNSESKMGQNGPEMGQNGSFWGGFGPFLGRSGSFRGHFGIILASFWHHLGLVLVLLWPHFEAFWAIFGPFWAFFFACFWARLGHFHRHVAIFLVTFWEVDCNIKQNDAREGKHMHFCCQNSPTSCKIVQKQAPFGCKTLFFP